MIANHGPLRTARGQIEPLSAEGGPVAPEIIFVRLQRRLKAFCWLCPSKFIFGKKRGPTAFDDC